MTYSFPCTDLSVAGKMQGMSKADWENGNSTHSGLLWEVERILKECKKEELPDVLLMENVPQVHCEQNLALPFNSAPHSEQNFLTSCFAPHSGQNFAFKFISAPQAHFLVAPFV